LLIKFDLQPLQDLIDAERIDINHPGFNASLNLFDVYGGQPTPKNFVVDVYPLSRSFDEGIGRDVVYYSDRDVANFLTASSQGTWLVSGCALGGGLPGLVDYVTASVTVLSGASLKSSQRFITGEEDLSVDVTKIVSATIVGLLPDEGFRISFDSSQEVDQHSYFVKRFASRTAYDEDKRPRLIIRYDDSVQDDSQNLYLDTPAQLFMYNRGASGLTNLVSGSAMTPVVGSNSVILRLLTEVSGGTFELAFTGSQHRNGAVNVNGVYSASVLLPSTEPVYAAKLTQSSSIKLTPIWGSLDGTVAYMTGSTIEAHPPNRSSTAASKQYYVTVTNVQDSFFTDEEPTFRINIFDRNSPVLKVVKTPVSPPGIVTRDVHWQVRDQVTGKIEIPFDTVYNSTRASADDSGMFFKLSMDSLTRDRSYVIDIMFTGEVHCTYKAVSPPFKVSDLR